MQKTVCDRCGGDIDMLDFSKSYVVVVLKTLMEDDDFPRMREKMDLCDKCSGLLLKWMKGERK